MYRGTLGTLYFHVFPLGPCIFPCISMYRATLETMIAAATVAQRLTNVFKSGQQPGATHAHQQCHTLVGSRSTNLPVIPWGCSTCEWPRGGSPSRDESEEGRQAPGPAGLHHRNLLDRSRIRLKPTPPHPKSSVLAQPNSHTDRTSQPFWRWIQQMGFRAARSFQINPLASMTRAASLVEANTSHTSAQLLSLEKESARLQTAVPGALTTGANH